MAPLLLVATQLGWLLLLAATAWASGWLLLGRRPPELLHHPILVVVGVAAIGQAAWVLALCGLLHGSLALALVIVVHAAAWRGWEAAGKASLAHIRSAPARAGLVVAAAALAVAPGFAIGLYPPTAFDELVYHLSHVRAIAATGAFAWLPELRVPTFPLLVESLQAPLLAAGGETATHLVPLLATVATAALLLAWGREGHQRLAGLLAAALFLGSPLVTYLAGSGYVETPLAMLVAGAFYAAWRASREASRGWAALAGLLAGTAAAVKYLGLYAPLAVVLYLAAAGRPRLSRAAVAAATAVASLAPTYVRLAVLTGDPVFPFFPRLFGTSHWTAAPPPGGLAARAIAALRLPYDAVFHRALAGGSPPLSPALLLGLPLLLVAAAHCPPARRGIVALAAYLPFLLLTFPDARFLLVLLPLWSLLVAIGLTSLWRSRLGSPLRRPLAALLALGLLLPGALYAPFYCLRAGPLPVGAGARQAYLAAHVPGYASLAWLEHRRGSGYVVYALEAEWLHGLARGRVLGDWAGPWRFGTALPLVADPPALRRFLRGRGAGYLLLRQERGRTLRARPAATDGFTWLHTGGGFELLAVR